MSPELTKALSQGGFCLALKYLEAVPNKSLARAELAELAHKGVIRFSKNINGLNLIVLNDIYPKQGGERLNYSPHKSTSVANRRTASANSKSHKVPNQCEK